MRLGFNHSKQHYMYKPESVTKNKYYQIMGFKWSTQSMVVQKYKTERKWNPGEISRCCIRTKKIRKTWQQLSLSDRIIWNSKTRMLRTNQPDNLTFQDIYLLSLKLQPIPQVAAAGLGHWMNKIPNVRLNNFFRCNK